MGYGNYSYEAHQDIASSRSTLSKEQVFSQREVHPLMNPLGVKMRESRDSPDHPNSVGIVFALDVTGSMGAIPDLLARKQLPEFMKTLMDCGVQDPQVLFMFVGDAVHDRGPLQAGQFESSASEMDQWLTWSWLEGGGGGNGSESYEMAMYFAARHTEMDCMLKRKKRGYYFMTGDENPYPAASKEMLQRWIGDVVPENVPLAQVCEELSRSFHPFFLIPDPARVKNCEKAWRKVLGDHVIVLEKPEDTCYVASALVGLCEGLVHDLDHLAQMLGTAGVSRDQIGSIVRSLTPFAATLRRDGTPGPRLMAMPGPAEDSFNGYR
jgi:hypothetical protein